MVLEVFPRALLGTTTWPKRGRNWALLVLPELLPRGGLRVCPAALSLFSDIPVRIRWNSRWMILQMGLYPFLFCLVRTTHLWRRYVSMKLFIFRIDHGALIVFEDAANLCRTNS